MVPIVGLESPWLAIEDALDALQEGKVLGKIVLSF
jgi:hypothetical protein